MSSSARSEERGGGRELLTLVVVDEPRSKKKFGADIAGKAAIRILRRAHGLSAITGAIAEAADAPPADAFNEQELPWAEEARW